MTVYTIPELAQIWTRNGGAFSHRVNAVAVALAESGGNPNAISPSSDYGLWQINTVNFAHFGLTTTSARNPDTNARVAIAMSGNGTNWAAWCSCWVHPERNCGHGFISSPQLGSPAGDNVQRVASVLGDTATAGLALVPESAPGVSVPAVGSAWAGFQDFVGNYAQWHYRAVNVTRGLIKGA